MVMRKLLLCIALCISPTLCGADEHAACTDIAYDWFSLPADELRSIAHACKSGRFSELNYLRAYHHDLVTGGIAASSPTSVALVRNHANFSAYTFHMLLTEQMARHYYPTMAGQLAFLIEEYEVENEIAELWLRGYDNLASRLSELRTRKTEIK
ncbi:MAG: hypothetical protein KJO66_06840 [Gammaproteobacteria bacterium]|nr:hypothetical protein [Gammaproteobacteria bacterium]